MLYEDHHPADKLLLIYPLVEQVVTRLIEAALLQDLMEGVRQRIGQDAQVKGTQIERVQDLSVGEIDEGSIKIPLLLNSRLPFIARLSERALPFQILHNSLYQGFGVTTMLTAALFDGVYAFGFGHGLASLRCLWLSA